MKKIILLIVLALIIKAIYVDLTEGTLPHKEQGKSSELVKQTNK